MYLIVGLGNPGSLYKNNRHNVGFLIIDSIVNTYQLELEKSKFKSEVFKGMTSGQKVMAIKPQTFMNNSGSAVAAFERFYKIGTQNTIVIYDDIDLELGKVKIKSSGGDAGHNGIKSINTHIENNYLKIRVGVGRPERKELVPNYVLSDFKDDEMIKIKKIADNISKALHLVFERNYDEFNSKINNMEM